jgi:hypothetical protein
MILPHTACRYPWAGGVQEWDLLIQQSLMDLNKSQVIDPAPELGMLRVDIVVSMNFGLDLVHIHSLDGHIAEWLRLQRRYIVLLAISL